MSKEELKVVVPAEEFNEHTVAVLLRTMFKILHKYKAIPYPEYPTITSAAHTDGYNVYTLSMFAEVDL